jgi:hypothetical protein
MFIAMSQSEVAYIAFANSFNYMGLNNIIFKNIEYLLLGTFIINSKKEENIIYHNNMNKGNKCNFLALRSL